MIGKGTRLYSMILHKCPRCHEGDLFTSGAYNMKRFTEMPEKCSHCGQRFMLEPYFYSGAMYVSYALQVALFIAVYVALRVLFNPPMETYMITTMVVALLIFPVTMRLSRSIYINFFVSYDKRFRQKHV